MARNNSELHCMHGNQKLNSAALAMKQGMNGSSPPRPVPSGDGCGQEGGGPFSQKVGRYSAEERKERIERYRVKRHQRNFNKKITVRTYRISSPANASSLALFFSFLLADVRSCSLVS